MIDNVCYSKPMTEEIPKEVPLKYKDESDINENNILNADKTLLELLLKDCTTKKNILWMTDNYSKLGHGYEETSEITIPLITDKNSKIIRPRISKTKTEQLHRIRDKAEVFTPSWICNKQNNLVDNAWFGRDLVFNAENGKRWKTNHETIVFPEGKTWQDYVLSPRLEVSCGEAPYLISRYDTTTGDMIVIEDRIGLLDRKLRIVTENCKGKENWIKWARKSFQSIYGFEWQGDSLLLARENALLSYIEYYKAMFNDENPSIELLREIAEIISWNLWQMDGIKFVVPLSCHDVVTVEQDFFEEQEVRTVCEGCKTGNINKHNGLYCRIKDWQKNRTLVAVSMLKEGK
ncbi:MAG: restriction endonuclease subunit M [Sphaerochaetaceae bacterium]